MNRTSKNLSESTPTSAELKLLHLLWKHGVLTVRGVHEAAYRGTEVGYTKTLRLLQNLLAKGLVRRDDSTRRHVYEALAPQPETMRQVVRGFIDRSFDGSAASLAMHALQSGDTSAEELAQLRVLIDQLERDNAEE
jgi:predicted transcriptional regulator